MILSCFKTEKEPKMKFFDFGAFQINGQMPSHDKIIFHMLFGAFEMPHFILLPVLKLSVKRAPAMSMFIEGLSLLTEFENKLEYENKRIQWFI